MDFEAVQEAVVFGNDDQVAKGVSALLAQGVAASEILGRALIPGMEEVGVRFETGECFIPEMMTAARAMQRAMDILEPVLTGSGEDIMKARVALGTVANDIHELGKNLVGMMLRGAGFEVHDLGVDVPVETFVAAAADGADVVGISCLLSTTMMNVPRVIEALDTAGLRSRVKVIVGGSPITQEFADQVGADGYAPDAAQAVDCVKNMLGIG